MNGFPQCPHTPPLRFRFPRSPLRSRSPCLPALYVRAALKREEPAPIADVMWSVLYIALLLVVAVFCALGGVDGQAGILDMSAYALVLLACGVATLFRSKVALEFRKLSGALGRAVHIGTAVVAIAFVSIVSAWIVDFVWLETGSSIQMQFFFLTSSLFAMCSVALYFLGQRGGALMVFVPICAVGFASPSISWSCSRARPLCPLTCSP